MADLAADDCAFFEATGFLGYFNDLADTRQPGKVVYPLDEVLLLALVAVLAGAETFTDIARFGDKKLALLRRFRPYRDGTPPMIRLATSSRRWTPGNSSAALWHGWPPSPVYRPE